MSIEIWQHKTSGERYVVEVAGEDIIAANGPVSSRDIEAVMQDGFDGDLDVLGDLGASPEAYHHITEAAWRS